MKRFALIFLMMISFGISIGYAQSLTTQGVLRDGTGHSVADNTYTMTFRIYDTETGGSAVWETTENVEVVNGIYNVTLGSVDDPLNMLESDQSYWLGVEVGSDGEMTPLLKISVSAFEMARLSGEENVFPSAGNVGIGTTSPSSNLHIANPQDVDAISGALTIGNSSEGMFLDNNEIQTTDNLYINKDNNVNVSINAGGGNVGIGTEDPGGILEIYGNGDANDNEHVTHPLEIRGEDQVLYMGTNTENHYAYIQSVDYMTEVSKLCLNARGGNVGIGTTNPVSQLQIANPADVNTNSGALTIGDASNGMFLDNNEIQTTGNLLINNDNAVNTILNRSGGNVGIGTSSPNATLDVAGNFFINGSAPFVFRRFTKDNDESVDFKTDFSYADWSAAVVGYTTGYCDIDEVGSEWSWKILMAVDDTDGLWHLYVRAPTHNESYPDWTVHVMFVKKELVDDNRY